MRKRDEGGRKRGIARCGREGMREGGGREGGRERERDRGR